MFNDKSYKSQDDILYKDDIYIDHLSNTEENKRFIIEHILKVFKDFIKLFKSNEFYNYKDIYSDNHNYYMGDIKNFIDLYTVVKEEDVKDKVSLLEIDLQQERIVNIDNKSVMNKLVDSIVNNLQEMEDKVSKSPILR
jgi:hypothetical protein